MCLTPFSSLGGPNGPTERAQIKSCLMEIDITVGVGGHVLRTNTLLLCHVMHKRLSFVLIWLAMPKMLDGPNTIFYVGTERTSMNSLVPFLPVPQG